MAKRFDNRAFAETAMLFALLLLFSLLESLIPPPPLPFPVRWGFANLVVMYALFFRNWQTALSLVVMKALFALATRGLIAFAMSGVGGLLSFVAMFLIWRLFGKRASIPFISILGALGHQLGQLLVLNLFYRSFGLRNFIRLVLPLTVIAYITGALTALVLVALLPSLQKLRR